MRVSLIVACVIIVTGLVWLSCSSESGRSDADAQLLEYAPNVRIDVELAQSSNLPDIRREDVFFTITNLGDKAITELYGDIILLNHVGEEVGRTGWFFIDVDKRLEKIAAADKKAKHRPLMPGQTLRMGTDVIYLFAGESALRDRAVSRWHDLAAHVAIKRVRTQESQQS